MHRLPHQRLLHLFDVLQGQLPGVPANPRQLRPCAPLCVHSTSGAALRVALSMSTALWPLPYLVPLLLRLQNKGNDGTRLRGLCST